MRDLVCQKEAAVAKDAMRVSPRFRQRVVAGIALSAIALSSVPAARANPAADSLDPATILTTEKPSASQCVEEVRMQRRIGLGIAGASIFGGTYLITAFIGTFNLNYLFIPIVGPAIEGARAQSGDGPVYVGVLSGLVQASGLAMMIAGFATKSRTLVYRDTQVSLAPYAGPGGAGLFAAGRF